MSLNVYEIITDRIIQSLEKGVVPWRCGWKTSTPKNLISKKAYRGINVLLLNSAKYQSNYWLTYRQASGLGGNVIKGSKSTPVIFWKLFDTDRVGADGKPNKAAILRYYSVFNVSQTEGIEAPVEAEMRPFTPIQECERIVEGYHNAPRIIHGGNQAAYSPTLDEIVMPIPESFESEEAYYCTMFHEMAHSSGHKDRLNREGITNPIKFASHSYSYEELIAETTSSFLCGEAGVLDKTYDNSVSYLQSWVSKLRSDPKMIIKASGEAAKAADLILNRKKEEEQEGEENT